MSAASAIQASIDSIDEEIATLTEARDTLVKLQGAEETEEVTKPSRRSRRKVEDEDDKPARRSRSRDKRADERKASSSTKSRAKSNGKDDDSSGPTKKEQIEGMLDEGMSPREIADELGIATNYVYNVKRAMA